MTRSPNAPDVALCAKCRYDTGMSERGREKPRRTGFVRTAVRVALGVAAAVCALQGVGLLLSVGSHR